MILRKSVINSKEKRKNPLKQIDVWTLTISKLYVIIFYLKQLFDFSSIYPFVASASAAMHSSWIPMLSLVTDPNDTVTSNSFDVFTMPDIMKVSCDIILNLVTLKKKAMLNRDFKIHSIDLALTYTFFQLIYDILHLIRIQ